MVFVDDVQITVKAGNGGNGGTAKKQMFGSKKTAPDGGNGGKGGDIYVKGDTNISDLSQFRFKKKIKAENGVNGLNKDLDGAKGEDTYILLPYGTTVTDIATGESVEILTDKPFCVAYGGEGGMGNHDYKPELRNFGPRKFEGEKGDERELHLVLNLIADIGLVGLPNAGKSSLLKVLTNAVPKVGSYPFTTLTPNLGVLNSQKEDGGRIVLADIPGLIEGASAGKGLGINFLKHIKKTKVLLHCLDASTSDVLSTYKTVRSEFGAFDNTLLQKKEIILLTKSDLVDSDEIKKQEKKLLGLNKEMLVVSIYNEKSLQELKIFLLSLQLK